MMARLRIVSKLPPQPANYPKMGICSSLADSRVFVIRDDGSEEELRSVLRVTWDSGDGRDVSIAKVTLADVDLDIETFGERG